MPQRRCQVSGSAGEPSSASPAWSIQSPRVVPTRRCGALPVCSLPLLARCGRASVCGPVHAHTHAFTQVHYLGRHACFQDTSVPGHAPVKPCKFTNRVQRCSAQCLARQSEQQAGLLRYCRESARALYEVCRIVQKVSVFQEPCLRSGLAQEPSCPQGCAAHPQRAGPAALADVHAGG